MEKEELQPCFDCLQRGVKTDFSDQIIFSYGVSDSPLPFGSCAVVQMSHGEASAHSQFVIEYKPRDDHDCLTKYVDDYVENHQGRKTHGIDNDTLSCEEYNEALEYNVRTLRVLSNSSLMVSKLLPDFGEKTSLGKVAYGSSNCKHSSWFSCLRTITALAPVAQIDICSYSFFQDLVLKFVSGCLEDHILCSLNLLIEGKASGRDTVNFLRLVGLPSFYEDNIPGCLRHPNIAPIIGLLKAPECVNLVLPKSPYNLENILHFSPNALKSEWHIRFLLYQLLSALVYLHSMVFPWKFMSFEYDVD